MSTALVTETRVATVISGKELAGDTQFSTIQDAIDYANSQSPDASQPWDVYIHPGIYTEVITMYAWVNLRGIGPKGAVVINQTNANVVTLADDVEIQNLTIRLTTPETTGKYLVLDNDVACTARIIDVIFEITTPVALANKVFRLTGAGDYTIERCSYDIGGTGANLGIENVTNAATIHLIDNDFKFTNTNAYHIETSVDGTWTGKGNRWIGTSAMFNITDGTFTFDNCALLATAAWTNTGTTITLRQCAIEATVVAGDLATVRLKDCSYRAISRSGTGNIVDESAELKDAPWKVHRWTWQALLANAQVVEREAAGGATSDGGTGQVILEVTDNVAGHISGVETDPEVAGSLGNEFTPARTPRFLTQISAHTDDGSGAGNPAFDPHAMMFYGLRQTLGGAVPLAAEHHAGFAWDNLDASVNKFWAISSDGTQEKTLLATPSDDAQHQLEVVVFGGQKVDFYVDGVLVTTHSTNIPANTLDWQHLLNTPTPATGGGDKISITVRNGGCQECPA